ncbi:ABC transporter permease [Virgibacillus phasianinus]|uniref:ABC transporter permease n=1 Tax=Virgibacillus phasianinus TaxID=2017483 RepID=A0A220U2H4_9BACI|nr:ABC transporter permease subunit [Virgibacillus phasianinus]ASK61973.1 ABC transporter permease [Virgibacillus phasianinus]
MRLVRVGIFYLLGVFGIICISVFPRFFATAGIAHPLTYFADLGSFIHTFIQPDSWLYQVPRSPAEFSLIGTLWGPFVYSMEILLGALLLGFSLAFIFAFLANFLSQRLVQGIKRVLDFFESIPDIVIASGLQILVIYVYHASGIELFRVASYLDEKAYLGPIITLAILPLVSLFKILLLMIEEEFLKDYVGFLRSKGIKKTGILLRHVFKNILPTTFHHSKVIIWATLSSQFVIERIFNVHGLTFYLVDSFTPMTIAASLILLFTPFFLFFHVVDLWINQDTVYNYQIKMNKNHAFQPFQRLKRMLTGIKHIKWHKFRPWAPFAIFFNHMKNYKFAIGSLFFILLISYSLIYSVTTDNHIDKAGIVYKDDGVTIKGTPPHPPPEPFLLGSDGAGFSIYDMLVVGAKYTLIFAIVIALLRVFVGLIGGVVYAFALGPKRQNWLEKMVDSIHFLPLSVIAYLLLAPILMEGFSGFAYTFTERIVLEIIILTVLVVPLTTVLLGNEMKRILNYEFIMSAKVLGGSRFHIFWRHVLPHIGARMTILFGQQFIQVLLIFMHLGIFNFFFGGTNVSFGRAPSPPRSITYEWSGLIGNTLNALNSGKYWLIVWVLLAFMLSIFAMQFIIQGVKEMQQTKVGVIYKLPRIRRKQRKQNQKNDSVYEPTAESFKPLCNDRR